MERVRSGRREGEGSLRIDARPHPCCRKYVTQLLEELEVAVGQRTDNAAGLLGLLLSGHGRVRAQHGAEGALKLVLVAIGDTRKDRRRLGGLQLDALRRLLTSGGSVGVAEETVGTEDRRRKHRSESRKRHRGRRELRKDLRRQVAADALTLDQHVEQAECLGLLALKHIDMLDHALRHRVNVLVRMVHALLSRLALVARAAALGLGGRNKDGILVVVARVARRLVLRQRHRRLGGLGGLLHGLGDDLDGRRDNVQRRKAILLHGIPHLDAETEEVILVVRAEHVEFHVKAKRQRGLT